ncbi:MAG: GNAT family N-acetyltransferase [Clostridiales bacterium]|nr:GNAT family N-acetyltransferase [Clostridiales bacterium]
MEVRLATISELQDWWDLKIAENPEDNSWIVWKNRFVENNINGQYATFFAFENGQYVGQCTLIFKNEDADLTGNGKAEINKLEINKEYRGQGKSTAIFNVVKHYAKERNVQTLTIGVEPCEIRNMQIYFHWGFTEYLKCTTETYPPKNNSVFGETITVLWYAQII